jgi:hypothetical protein
MTVLLPKEHPSYGIGAVANKSLGAGFAEKEWMRGA